MNKKYDKYQQKMKTERNFDMKKLICTFTAALICFGSLGAPAYAESSETEENSADRICRQYDSTPYSLKEEDSEFYEALIRITEGNREEGDFEKVSKEREWGFDVIFSEDLVSLYHQKKAATSFEYYFFKRYDEYWQHEDFGVCADYEFFTGDRQVYRCSVRVLDDPIVTAEEAVSAAGVPDGAEITAIRLDMHYHVLEELGNWYQVVSTDICSAMYHIDLSRDGWYLSGELGQYLGGPRSAAGLFYVRNGKVVTGTKMIEGIRYRFDGNGAYLGTYTGWTKNEEKGWRLWGNGILQRGEIWLESGRYWTNEGYWEATNPLNQTPFSPPFSA